jgi:probable addiction module antidote protein
MAAKTLPYDSAEYLDDDQAIAEYLEEAMKIATKDSDPSFLIQALGTVARARGMSQIARDAGLSRESLYKALGAEGNPEFVTILRVLQALRLKLSIKSQGNDRPGKRIVRKFGSRPSKDSPSSTIPGQCEQGTFLDELGEGLVRAAPNLVNAKIPGHSNKA